MCCLCVVCLVVVNGALKCCWLCVWFSFLCGYGVSVVVSVFLLRACVVFFFSVCCL